MRVGNTMHDVNLSVFVLSISLSHCQNRITVELGPNRHNPKHHGHPTQVQNTMENDL